MGQENSGNADGPLSNRALPPEEVDEWVADCPGCGSVHEWVPDGGWGDAVGMGWAYCPDDGQPYCVDREDARAKP